MPDTRKPPVKGRMVRVFIYGYKPESVRDIELREECAAIIASVVNGNETINAAVIRENGNTSAFTNIPRFDPNESYNTGETAWEYPTY